MAGLPWQSRFAGGWCPYLCRNCTLPVVWEGSKNCTGSDSDLAEAPAAHRVVLKVFDDQIESAPFEHVAPGKAHHVPNLLAIAGVVAMFGAVFTLGLGVHGAAHSLDGAVEHQFGTFAAKLNIQCRGMGGKLPPRGRRGSLSLSVFCPAVHLCEFRQNADVLADLLRFCPPSCDQKGHPLPSFADFPFKRSHTACPAVRE